MRLKPVEEEGRWKQHKEGEGIRIDNKDKITHPFLHSCFAQNVQPHIQKLHHHHDHCY